MSVNLIALTESIEALKRVLDGLTDEHRFVPATGVVVGDQFDGPAQGYTKAGFRKSIPIVDIEGKTLKCLRFRREKHGWHLQVEGHFSSVGGRYPMDNLMIPIEKMIEVIEVGSLNEFMEVATKKIMSALGDGVPFAFETIEKCDALPELPKFKTKKPAEISAEPYTEGWGDFS